MLDTHINELGTVSLAQPCVNYSNLVTPPAGKWWARVKLIHLGSTSQAQPRSPVSTTWGRSGSLWVKTEGYQYTTWPWSSLEWGSMMIKRRLSWKWRTRSSAHRPAAAEQLQKELQKLSPTNLNKRMATPVPPLGTRLIIMLRLTPAPSIPLRSSTR